MPRGGGAGQGQGRAQARPSQGQARGRGQSRAQALAQALAPEERVLARMESVQEALEVKDSLLAELYVSHIAQRWEHTTTTSTLGPRQTVKTELVGRRTVLAARHEEETLRMEADILKIRAEMDLLAGELQELVEQGEGQVVAGADTTSTSTTTSPTSSSSSKSESFSLPCPSCPVCLVPMAPPTSIYQCAGGHLVCGPCRDKLHVTTCRTCLGEYVGRAEGMEHYLHSLFLN